MINRDLKQEFYENEDKKSFRKERINKILKRIKHGFYSAFFLSTILFPSLSNTYQSKHALEMVKKFKFNHKIEYELDEIIAYDKKSLEDRYIDTIVVHTTDGNEDLAEWWLTVRDKNIVSAHYLVREDGKIKRLVREKDIAYHCRRNNKHSLGLEFGGHHSKPFTDIQFENGILLMEYLIGKYDIKRVKGHYELDPYWRLNAKGKWYKKKDPGVENLDKILIELDNRGYMLGDKVDVADSSK